MSEHKNEKENFPNEIKNKYLNEYDVDYNVQEYKQSGKSKRKEPQKSSNIFGLPLITSVVIIFVAFSLTILLFVRGTNEVVPEFKSCHVFLRVMTTALQPIQNAEVTFLDVGVEKDLSKSTDEEGNVNFKIPINSEIDIIVKKEGFQPLVYPLKIERDNSIKRKIIKLEKSNNEQALDKGKNNSKRQD